MILTLREGLERAVKNFSEQVCILFRRKNFLDKYTYQEIYNSSLKVANWLLSSGIKKGERVAIILENCPQWCIAYFGTVLAAAVAVPIDVQLSSDEVNYCLKDSQCKVIFASASLGYLKDLEKLDFLEKIVVIGETFPFKKGLNFSEILSLSFQEVLPPINPQDLASFIYTSGTTGLPKAVMLTHNNFCSNYLSIRKLNLLRPNDKVLSILPLHHSYAFLTTLITPLFLGVKIVYIETINTAEILEALKEEKITLMIVVPQILSLFSRRIKERIESIPFPFRLFSKLILEVGWFMRRLLKINLSKLFFSKIHSHFGPNLRFFVCGGAKLEEEVALFLSKLGFKILEGYGLTEASPVVSFNPPNRPKIGSVGKALPDVEVKILNPNRQGVGEILIRGQNVMKGYYKRPQETAEVLKDGWLYSGDLGYMDKKGYLFIKERLKEIIVLRSGKNISPQEVESLIIKSPFIKEVCVLPSEKEEVLAAVVVPDWEYFKKIKETNVYDTVRWNLDYLLEKLPPYKRIKSLVLIDEDLPRTRLGKIKRFKVSQIYKENLSKKVSKPEANLDALSSLAKKVLDILKKLRNFKSISLDDHLELDLGIDSLERIEIIMALEKSLGLKMKEEEFSQIFTVGELIANIEKLALKQEGAREEKDSIYWRNILDSPPQLALRRKISLDLSLASRLFTFLGAAFLNLIFRVFFRLKVSGLKSLPKESFLICPNHTSYLDGFIVFSALPLSLKYNLFFLGLSQYFEKGIIRGLIRYLRVIPVELSSNVVEAMKAASLVLKNKKILCVFPEGSRSVDGELKEFKKGIGILAKELDIKVVPVYIKGAYSALKPTARFPRLYPIKIIFGKPYSYQELRKKGLDLNKKADDYQAISLGIREEVLALKKGRNFF